MSCITPSLILRSVRISLMIPLRNFRITEMNKALFNLLADSSGENMPLLRESRDQVFAPVNQAGPREQTFRRVFFVMRERSGQ